MKLIPIVLMLQLTIALAGIFPAGAFPDQKDTRLNDLFSILQSSDDPILLQETETRIWEIWHESGRKEIDILMEEASEATQLGKLEYAESIYSRIVDVVPEFSEGWNRRATVRYYQKDYDSSLEDIKQTLILEPRHFGATWGLGMIFGLNRNFPAAIAAFERLLELKPNSQGIKQRIELLRQEMIKGAV